MKTIASMVFHFNGKAYPYEYDFGENYSEESAEFMFTEGNYGCDCNRLLFLGRAYPELNVDETSVQCGDSIKMTDFKVITARRHEEGCENEGVGY